MLYEIASAVAHPDHRVTITWSDGAHGVVNFTPCIDKGGLFAALQDAEYFVREMRVLRDGIRLTWPNEVDFSSDGLRQDAFPKEDTGEFENSIALPHPEAVTIPPTTTPRASRTAISKKPRDTDEPRDMGKRVADFLPPPSQLITRKKVTPLVPNAATGMAIKAARRGELVTAGKPKNLLASLNAEKKRRP